jgi:hypothetical protein
MVKLTIQPSMPKDWIQSVACPSGGGCLAYTSLAILDTSMTKIYVLQSYNYALQFYTLNETSGATLGTQYFSGTFATQVEVYSMLEANERVFMLYGDNLNYILIYDIQTDTFTSHYSITSSVYLINALAYSSSNFIYL